MIIIARGTIAKQVITKKLQDAFGADFLGEFDKKIYLQAPENGEMVQIAISLTCPKNPIQVATNISSDEDWDFSDNFVKNTAVAINNAPPAEITDEEKSNISSLMEKLGL